jgi:hypothetical protein
VDPALCAPFTAERACIVPFPPEMIYHPGVGPIRKAKSAKPSWMATLVVAVSFALTVSGLFVPWELAR